MKLLGLVPNYYIHVSVSDLYIPTIGPPILVQQECINRLTGTYMNVGIGNVAAQVHFSEEINRMGDPATS
jgi:hypothetical protein